MAVDGSGRQLLYAATSTAPVPFPTVASRQLILHDMVTGADRVLGVTGSAQITPFITANGRYVVYGSVGDSHAFDTMTAATIDFPRVDRDGVSYYPVHWSQDLRFVLYAIYGNLANQEVARLFVYDRDSATVAELPLGGKTPVSTPRLSPDARYVSFGSRPAAGIWLLDRLTGDLRSLSPLAEQARVSASAQFTSDSRFAVSLGVTYETANGRAVVRSPRGTSSPNGRYIVYGCSEDPRDLQFCVYDQITTLTSHLPMVAISPPPYGPLKSAVVDDLGHVFFAYSGEIFSTCGTLFVPPPPILYSDLGDTLDLALTLSSGGPCNWTAQSNAPWLTITSAPIGSGSATVQVVVSANPGGARRIGTLTIAGQTVVVTQGQNPNVPPGAPVALRSPLSGIGSLIWNPPFDGGRVRNYIIEGGSTPGATDRFRIVSDGSTTSAPIALSQFVNCCGVLYLRVRAANEFGESIASNEVALKLPSPGAGCVYPPDAPEGFAATVEGSTVRLGWRPPAAPGGQIASYVIEAGSASGLTNLAHFITRNTGLGLLAPDVPSGIYFARVRALNTCGEGPASNEIVVTVP